MNDELTFKLAFATSILGILGIIIFSGQVYPPEIHINAINHGMIDHEISIQGVVENISESKSSQTYFLEIADNTGKISVVVFHQNKEDYEKYNLKLNNLVKRRINVVGTVTEYDGHLELILKDPKSIKIIS